LQIERLLSMLDAADQERHTHHAVHDDHDHGEEHIAHQSRIGTAMPYDCRDCDDLDRGMVSVKSSVQYG